jgi:hypothetical protein
MSNVPVFPLAHPSDDGIRPAGAPDECLYCKQKVGTPHLADCVVVYKKVRLRLIVEVEVDQPHHWTPEKIESFIELHGCAGDDDLANGERTGCEFIAVVDPTPHIVVRSPLDHQSGLFENN